MLPQLNSNLLRFRWFNSRRLATILILLIAFTLRLHDLETKPLWFDEAMEYWVATASPVELPQSVLQALQDPPLYSAILSVWQHVGIDEFILRYLSLLASVIAVAALFSLATSLRGWQLGVVAAALMAILPPEIRFAQEVGQYALAVCALTLNLLALQQARTTNRWSYWFAWALTSLLAIYTYFGTILVLVPTSIVTMAVLLHQRQPAVKRLFGTAAATVLLALPLLIVWLPAQLFRGPTRSAFQITVNSLPEELSTLLIRTQAMLAYQLTGLLPEPSLWQIRLQQGATALILLLLLIGFLYSTRRSDSFGLASRWFGLCTLASWGTHYLANRLGIYPYGGTRHALILSPFILLIMAIGLLNLWHWKRVIGTAAFLAILVVAFISPLEPPEDLRTVTRYWLSRRDEHTPTYIYYNAVPGFRYQLQLAKNTAGPTPLFPPPLWYIDCWEGKPEVYCAVDGVVYGRWIRLLPTEEKHTAILAAFDTPPEAFWLVFSHTEDAERNEVLQSLSQDYTIGDQLEATGAAVYLLSNQ